MSQYIRKLKKGDKINPELNDDELHGGDINANVVTTDTPTKEVSEQQTVTQRPIEQFQQVTEQKPKVGKFTYLGSTYDIDDNLLSQWGKYVAEGNADQRNSRAKILSALRKAKELGEDLTIDGDGTITASDEITNTLLNGFNDSQKERLGKERSGLAKFFSANFTPNSALESFRRGVQGSMDFTYKTPYVDESISDLPAFTWDDVTYQVDENGKYLQNANYNVNKRINDAKSYLGQEYDAWSKSYSSGTDRAKGMWDWRDQIGGGVGGNWSQMIDNAFSRLQNNEATAEDLALLKVLGIIPGQTPAEIQAARDQATADAEAARISGEWDNRGFGDGLKWTKENRDKYSDIFIFNDDGTISINPNAFANITDKTNAWFNDYWTGDERLKGFVKLRNNIYNASDAGVEGTQLYRFLNNPNGFRQRLGVADYNGAEQLMSYLWGNNADNMWDTFDGESYYSNALSGKPHIKYRVVTGKYNVNLPDGYQMIEYIDTKNGNQDAFGNRETRYAILDRYGNIVNDDIYSEPLEDGSYKIRSFGDPNEIGATLKPENEWTYPSFNAREIVTDRTDKRYGWIVKHSGVENNGEIQGSTVYERPNKQQGSPNYAIHFDDPSLTNDFLLPDNIYQLFDKYDILSKIEQHNYADQKREIINFFKVCMGEKMATNCGWKTFKKLGMSDEDAKQVWKLLKDTYATGGHWRPSMIANMQKYVLPQYGKQAPAMRNGGILKGANGLLAQFGRATGNSAASTTKHVDGKLGDYRRLSNVSDLASGQKWTDADKAQMAALALELTSLGVAIADVTGTVGQVAAAGAGVGSSIASWRADQLAGRNGVGTLATNLAFDAATLLPIVGDAAKAGKAAKAVTKALPTLIKVMSAVGMGNAAMTIKDKVAKGEKLNIADYRAILGGISGGLNLYKTGGFGKSTTKEKVGVESILKSKKTDVDVEFMGNKFKMTPDEVAKLKSAKTQEDKAKIALEAMKRTDKMKDYQLGDINDSNWTSMIKSVETSKPHTSFTLKAEDALEISKIKGRDKQIDAIADKISKQTGLTIDEVKSSYDISSVVQQGRIAGWNSSNGKKWQIWKKAEGPKIGRSNLVKDGEPIPVEANGNFWHDWWSSVGEYNTPNGTRTRAYGGTSKTVDTGKKRITLPDQRVIEGNEFTMKDPTLDPSLPVPMEYVKPITEVVYTPYGRMAKPGAWNYSWKNIQPRVESGFETYPEEELYVPQSNPNAFKKGGIIKAANGIKTSVGERVRVDKQDVLQLADYLSSVYTNKKMNEKNHETKPLIIQSTQFDSPRFQSPGNVDAVTKASVQNKPLSEISDSRQNAAIMQSKYATDLQALQKAINADSQAYGQYLDKVTTIDNQNKQNAIATANQNEQSLNQHYNTMIQSDINTMYGNWQSLTGLAKYFGNKIQQSKDATLNAANVAYRQKEAENLYNSYVGQGSEYYRYAEALRKAQAADNTLTEDEFIRTHRALYDAAQQAMKNYQMKMSLINSYSPYGPYIDSDRRFLRDQFNINLPQYKSGGKVSSESKSYYATRESVGDKAYLAQLKAAQRLIQQSNAAMLKSLLK